MKFREKIAFEKAHMNKIRYVVNYKVVPLYALVSVICFVLVGVLMTIDESRYTPAATGLFIFFGIMTIAFLITGPYVRKKEIAAEMARYDFNLEGLESRDVYDFSDEEVSFGFDSNGMYINDTFFWYNHLRIIIATSNYLNRVWIKIRFYINESAFCEIPLNGGTINMINKFNIKLGNRAALDYIIRHKKAAFTKIYKTGHL